MIRHLLALCHPKGLLLEGVVALDLLVQVLIDHDKLTHPCTCTSNHLNHTMTVSYTVEPSIPNP